MERVDRGGVRKKKVDVGENRGGGMLHLHAGKSGVKDTYNFQKGTAGFAKSTGKRRIHGTLDQKEESGSDERVERKRYCSRIEIAAVVLF